MFSEMDELLDEETIRRQRAVLEGKHDDEGDDKDAKKKKNGKNGNGDKKGKNGKNGNGGDDDGDDVNVDVNVDVDNDDEEGEGDNQETPKKGKNGNGKNGKNGDDEEDDESDDGEEEDGDDEEEGNGKKKKNGDDEGEDDDKRSALNARPSPPKTPDDKPFKKGKPPVKLNPKMKKESVNEMVDLFTGLELLTEKMSDSEKIRLSKKKARTLKRIKHKLKRGKRLASKRVANREKLMQRSRREARNLIMKKLSGGKDVKSMSIAARVRLQSRAEKYKGKIDKLSKRLVKGALKKELARVKKARAGKQE